MKHPYFINEPNSELFFGHRIDGHRYHMRSEFTGAGRVVVLYKITDMHGKVVGSDIESLNSARRHVLRRTIAQRRKALNEYA